MRYRPVIVFRDGSSRLPVQARKPAYHQVGTALRIVRRAMQEAQPGLLARGYVVDRHARGAGAGVVAEVAP